MSEETDHYFKVFVSGYVFLNLPKTTPAEHVIEPVTGSIHKREKCRTCNGRGIV